MNKFLLIALFAIFFYECKKDEVAETILIDQKENSMNSADTKQLTLTYSDDGLKTKSYNWTSRDENVVTVSGSGFITGVRVGETYVLVSSIDGTQKDSTKVKIIAKYNLYKEPYLVLGSTMSEVKAKETRVLTTNQSTSLFYSGENSNVREVYYSFTDGLLSGAIVLLANTTDVAMQVTKFLPERYEFKFTSDNIYFFSNNKGLYAVLSVHETLGLNVLYMKDSSLKSAGTLIELFKKAITQFEIQQRFE